MKILKRFLFLMLLAIVGYVVYIFYFVKEQNTNAISLIPKDAVYILEAKKPLKAWSKFSSSEMWKHIKSYPSFQEIGESANAIDKMLSDNKTLFKIFSLKDLLISAHVTQARDYDFLFLTNLSKASNSSLLTNNLDKLFALADYEMSQLEFKGNKINVCRDREDNSKLYVVTISNYLVCSYNLGLVKKSLVQYYLPNLEANADFKFVQEQTSSDGLIKLYLNYKAMPAFLKVYMQSVDPGVAQIMNQMHFSGLSGELEDSYLKFHGNSNCNDSLKTVLSVLSKSGSSKMGVHKILSEKTAMLMRLGFSDFDIFLANSMALGTVKELKSSNRALQLMELVLGISIKEDFLSWIGDEIAVSQYYNEGLIGNKVPKLIAIKVSDKKKAKEKLDKIFRQFKRRLPFKFEEYEFRGYPIRYMETKGVFKMIFGKMFDKVEKPYFSFIEDYAVFCDDPKILLQTILDFEEGRTLEEEDAFKLMNKTFSKESSFFTYISPKLYFNNFKGLLNTTSFNELQKNKEYINCFNGTGFLLKAEGAGLFKTELESSFLKEEIEVPIEENLEEEEIKEWSEIDRFVIEKLNNNAVKNYYPSGILLSVQSVNASQIPDGTYLEYWENEEVKIRGKYKYGAKTGTWRYYNEDGDLVEKVKIR